MPTVVICPSCQSKGTIPDGARLAQFAAPSVKRHSRYGEAPAVGFGPPGPAIGIGQTPVLLCIRRFGRSPAVKVSVISSADSAGSPAGPQTSGPTPLIYAILGVSGVAVLRWSSFLSSC